MTVEKVKALTERTTALYEEVHRRRSLGLADDELTRLALALVDATNEYVEAVANRFEWAIAEMDRWEQQVARLEAKQWRPPPGNPR